MKNRLCFLIFLFLSAIIIPVTGCADGTLEKKDPQTEQPAPSVTLQATPVATPQAAAAPEIPWDRAQISPPPEQPPEPGPRFAVIPSRVTPGEPVTVAFTDDFSGPGSRDFFAVLINSQGRRLSRTPFFNFTLTDSGQEVKTAVLAIPSGAGAGAYLIRIEAPGRLIADLPVVADPRSFLSEEIDLNEENTQLRVAPDPQKTAESEALWAILSNTGTAIYDTGPFRFPVSSTRRTSFFADRRTYRYTDNTSDTSVHAGIDYGVPTGTEVRSCAAGRVILARFRIVTGYSVVIEHLPGVYSLYYHMDQIEIREGDIIGPGIVLGRSGATGLATGPHLHWEIRVGTEFTDPDAFIGRAVLDKDEILAKLDY